MIKVDLAQEPQNFNARVRIPGNAFLGSLQGQQPDFDGHEYWRRSLTDLHVAYESICAYTCHWIPLDTGSDTVEHFLPKKLQPARAYDWANFRLVCARMNSRKREFQDVVDAREPAEQSKPCQHHDLHEPSRDAGASRRGQHCGRLSAVSLIRTGAALEAARPMMFAEEELPRCLRDTEDVRRRLQEMLDKMRAAASWPWKSSTVSVYRESLWPSLLGKLGDESEATRLRSEMETEIARLDAAA